MSREDDSVDILRCYLRDVRRFALLEAEEEQRLVCLIEDGRQAAAALAEPGVSPRRQRALRKRVRRARDAHDQLVVSNLRLVVPIAKRYAHIGSFHGLELLDLIQEGNLGLLKAVENLASGYGKLSTYATPWIRRRITRGMTEQSRILRLPRRAHSKLNRLDKEERWYRAEKGRPPTQEELAIELGIDTAELETLRQVEQDAVSLNQPIPNNETGATYEDLVEDPQAKVFAQRTADREWLAWLLAGVSERSRRILEWHFGHGLTLEEIGRRENVSRERVRQIAREALEKLRDSVRGLPQVRREQ